MLGLLVLWGYLVFMQLLIVWNSDLASDAPWYVVRIAHGWGIVAAVIFAVHFAIPFLLLLWPQVQRSRRRMLGISGLLIAAEVPRAWWLVIPSSQRSLSWVDCFAMLAVFGLAAALALRAPRLPVMRRLVLQHG